MLLAPFPLALANAISSQLLPLVYRLPLALSTAGTSGVLAHVPLALSAAGTNICTRATY
jgi:hypothetical protein